MSAKKVTVAVPAEPAEVVRKGPPVDEFHGQGGSYVMEPGADARTRVVRPLAGDEAEAVEQEGGV